MSKAKPGIAPAVGELVRFYPVAGRRIYEERVVREVLPEGIPSCREPMLMLEGKPGVVLAAHCKVVSYYGKRAELFPQHDNCDCMACRPWTT